MGEASGNPSKGRHHDAPSATGIASPSGKTLPSTSASQASMASTAASLTSTTKEEPMGPDRRTTVTTPGQVSKTGTAQDSQGGSPVGSVTKREDYISWDDYFMGVAFLSAMRSKDPSTQVGACLVDTENKIVGIGYNGFPRGCSDDALPWARQSDGGFLDTKYAYVCHAEMNAILNRNIAPLHDCRMYVALFPCNECAKLIIQSGVKDVIYLSDKYHDDAIMVASRRLFDLAGVRYRKHTPKVNRITIDFSSA
ncbi:deoxycytidylate deaminase [Nannochloropsis gaditana]|uniref:dCMP deaminase n=1 Tax=Nannochloropsis gaditana TaxID=72520 RepID=W7U952_9STRA|nr:deoxycytidylate deaminase [Nannochloropsis gaditana]